MEVNNLLRRGVWDGFLHLKRIYCLWGGVRYCVSQLVASSLGVRNQVSQRFEEVKNCGNPLIDKESVGVCVSGRGLTLTYGPTFLSRCGQSGLGFIGPLTNPRKKILIL